MKMYKSEKATLVLYSKYYDNTDNFILKKITVPKKARFLGTVIREYGFEELPEKADVLETESGGLIFVPTGEYELIK